MRTLARAHAPRRALRARAHAHAHARTHVHTRTNHARDEGEGGVPPPRPLPVPSYGTYRPKRDKPPLPQLCVSVRACVRACV